jgi:hypothetical protein
MASPTDVKTYLAHWFQLGKKVVSDSGHISYHSENIIQCEHFSAQFEACWAAIMVAEGKGLYLEGTDQTIAELLLPTWEVVDCARCQMPVPMPQVEIRAHACPCNDLPSWPNSDIPQPRLPVNSRQHLGQMQDRLASLSQESKPS